MATSALIQALLFPEEEQKTDAQRKTNAYLTNPFLKKDGTLVNKYLDYERLLNDANTSDKVKRYIAQATGMPVAFSSSAMIPAASAAIPQDPLFGLTQTQESGAAVQAAGNPVFSARTPEPVAATAVPPTAPSASTGDTKGAEIVSRAREFIGVPYVWGGQTPDGFDCSGLVQYVYNQAGVQVPRVTWDQMKVGTPVSTDNLQPGDLIFFRDGAHVGIYSGDGKYIQAPRTGESVKESILDPKSVYVSRRIIE